LLKNISKSLHFSPESQFKIVQEPPLFQCKNYYLSLINKVYEYLF
jgi:hypothetical protein